MASQTPTPAPANVLRPVAAAQLPGLLDHGAPDGLRRAVRESLSWLDAQPSDATFVFGPRVLTAAQHRHGLEVFLAMLDDAPSPEILRERVVRSFDLLESVGDANGEVLFTGYYEPLIAASLAKSPDYQVPIYAPPDDRIQIALDQFGDGFGGKKLVGRLDGGKLLPYWERRAIREAGPLAGRGLEIGWAKDAVELFFLEVQGSGSLSLPDGTVRRIGYAGTNGRTYKSIGKLLIDQGKVPRAMMSMQAIREYLEGHPDEVAEVLDYNPSMVFFQFLEGGALGSLGRPVTAGRSIATDRNLFPKGALGYVETRRPELAADGTVTDGGVISRFVLNQDTGGAIRGPDRADFFWGSGPAAARTAGQMRQRGRLFFLALKE